jgi:hypothetical protein
MKQKNFSLSVYAKANMVNNGKAFAIVQTPDYNGGHYFRIEKDLKSDLGDFEYYAWIGTPQQFAEQCPVFLAHAEPLHEEPVDYWQTFCGVEAVLKANENLKHKIETA